MPCAPQIVAAPAASVKLRFATAADVAKQAVAVYIQPH
jgi:hypothetical protein